MSPPSPPNRVGALSSGDWRTLFLHLQLSENYQEEMQKFMEHLKQQARATYVPIGCAEKILEQVGAFVFTVSPQIGFTAVNLNFNPRTNAAVYVRIDQE